MYTNSAIIKTTEASVVLGMYNVKTYLLLVLLLDQNQPFYVRFFQLLGSLNINGQLHQITGPMIYTGLYLMGL
jgi:hypothetical protein